MSSMNWWRRFAKREQMERHLDAELRFHFDGLVADNLRAGMSEPEAHRSARLEFGGLEQVKEGVAMREAWAGWRTQFKTCISRCAPCVRARDLR